MSIDRFIALWTHPLYPPDRVTAEALDEAERALEARFPRDYGTAVLSCGLPRPTIALLDTIVEGEIDLHDVGDFFFPADIVRQTRDGIGAGLPADLIVFAVGSAGDLFCFPRNQETAQSAPVVLFDHNAGTIHSVAPSFDAWIEVFCEIAPR